MRTVITIEYISVHGINPERPDLKRKDILDSLELMTENICRELVRHFQKKKIKTKIVHFSE